MMSASKFTDWRTTQKYIRVAHNKTVKEFFKLNESYPGISPNLRNSVLIYKNDSATQCLIKMKFFEQSITNYDALKPIIPEWWQVRKGADVPQLVVVFKPKKPTKENKTSRWSFSLPHFINSPDKVKQITGFHKGNVQGMLTFNDNSKIIIYGKHRTEVKATLKKWSKAGFFNSKHLDPSNLDLKIGDINTRANFKELEIIPSSAKYFGNGQTKTQPDWQVWV